MSKRLFIAFELPAVFKSRMRILQEKIMAETGSEGIRWVSPENMHITAAFLGQVKTENIPEIKKAMSSIDFKPVEITVSRPGFFMKRGIPAILYMDVQNAGQLESRSIELRSRLADNAVHFDRKPFKAHITIARLKKSSAAREVHHYVVNKLDKTEGGQYTIKSMVLYESALTKNGSIYTEIYSNGEL
ncbi:MAG: RNA 2',3'-cyclic phosphodiesterase [candidate division WOR-3 bacterium]|nr:RNA 2',3'-cyclic phosphodiesterase [candidate division WOR-3 bacterium]